ncbi:MAG TPA: polysaccharide biosynthesis/export family protein [Polyangia bacterium]|nr:polysaccharide biosynthesis/export family protein [Polyangia bacterium]
MRKTVRFALTLLSFGLGAGCAHETTPPPATPRAEYRIGREDVVTVEVWKDPALSAKVPVRPDGKISLPMIGDVAAEGRTAGELKVEIAERLKPFVEQPVVGVMVSEVNAAKFFVLGEVAHPGAFPVRGEVSVIQALALAGGPTEFANQRSVVVIRPSQGKQSRYKVDCREVLAGNAPAIALMPGDTVFVP